MKNYIVTLSEFAQKDLIAIRGYILCKLKSEQGAKRIAEKLQDRIERLSEMPIRYPLYANLEMNRFGVRVMPVEKFHVFYRVDKDTVVVLRIVYGKKNFVYDDSFVFEKSSKGYMKTGASKAEHEM